MATGSTPGRGPFGRQVNRCVRYLLENAKDDGYITAQTTGVHGRMYGHGFATLFLAEVYGMTLDVMVREKLAKAVQLIVTSQNDEGGWRYEPTSEDADLSVTICQVMALRAARNAGIYVPKAVVDRYNGY